MNKSAFCAQTAARTGVSRTTADALVSATVSASAEALARKESVAIGGSGAFSTRSRPARQRRNPATGGSIAIPASGTPAFKAGKKRRETATPQTAPGPVIPKGDGSTTRQALRRASAEAREADE